MLKSWLLLDLFFSISSSLHIKRRLTFLTFDFNGLVLVDIKRWAIIFSGFAGIGGLLRNYWPVGRAIEPSICFLHRDSDGVL